MERYKCRLLATVGVGLLSSSPELAVAQGMDEAVQNATRLEEIVVTARRRAENLQDTPISISAVTAEGLERRGIDNVTEIGRFSPNVQFNEATPISGNNSTAAIFIRGIGQNDFTLSSDPGVGLYLDGVYISRSVGNLLDVLDVERIEVLRGPQGTLFGRNTIGGAINVVTRKPGEALGGSVELTTGRFNRAEGRLAINVPLAETLFSSVGVFYRYREGFVKGVGPNAPDLGDDNKLAGRLALRWVPSNSFDFTIAFDGSTAREESSPTVLIRADETAPAPSYWNAVLSGNGAVCADPTNPARLSDPRCYNSQWELGPYRHGGAFTTILPGFNDILGEPYRSASDIDIYGISATAEWNVSDVITLKSITGFRKVVGFWPREADHSPANIVQTVNTWEQTQFTQELQLQGQMLDDRLKFIAGAYFSDDKGEHIDVVQLNDAYFYTGNDISGNSYALFGQATFEITDALSVTAGIRWTEDEKTFDPDQYVVEAGWIGFLVSDGQLLVPRIAETITAKAWTPMATLSYRWTPELMTYVSYSEGFKGGGFTQRIFPPQPTIPSFNPEEVETYEAGFKSDLFDGTVRLNGAVFENKYRELQITVNDPTLGFAPVIRNAGRASITGAELELQARPVPELNIEAGIGYLDAKYKQVGIPGFTSGVNINSKLQNTPKWTLSAGASYEIAIGAGTLSPRIDWAYRSKVYNNAENTPELVQSGYHLLNASLAFVDESESLTVRAGVKNLTKEAYLVSGYIDSFGGLIEGNYGRPREWYLSVKRAF